MRPSQSNGATATLRLSFPGCTISKCVCQHAPPFRNSGQKRVAEAAQCCGKSNVALNGRFREMNVSGDEGRKSPWYAPMGHSLGVGRESIALP